MIGIRMNNKKDSVKLELLEQSNIFLQSILQRIEIKLHSIDENIYKNNEKINIKIEKLETKIENKIKWLFNSVVMVFFSSAGLALTAYEIWRKLE
jgi:hypothetical protein